MKPSRSVRSRRMRKRLRKSNQRKTTQKYLPILGLSLLSLSSLAAFFEIEIPFNQSQAAELPESMTSRAGLYGQDAAVLSAVNGQALSEVMQEAKGIAAQALEKTEVLRSQAWDTSVSEQAWRQVELSWRAAEKKLATVVASEPIEANRSGALGSGALARSEAMALDEVKTRYHDYSNRQDLTLAIEAYQQSSFIAAQLDPSEATLCDVETQLSDSPEKWEMVVSLRQQSVDHLKAVARNVSFYEEQVVPLMSQYQQALTTATRMHQRSPWYYAIQKAVCATQWADRAKASGERSDWAQAAAFWKEGIALLESAPERIPSEIPNQYRESYQVAQGNLELWKENLKDVEMRIDKE